MRSFTLAYTLNIFLLPCSVPGPSFFSFDNLSNCHIIYLPGFNYQINAINTQRHYLQPSLLSYIQMMSRDFSGTLRHANLLGWIISPFKMITPTVVSHPGNYTIILCEPDAWKSFQTSLTSPLFSICPVVLLDRPLEHFCNIPDPSSNHPLLLPGLLPKPHG